jgi:hypothetical protein
MAIYLEPKEHKYYNTEKPNVVYTSVTTVLGKYHEKFDEDKWSKIVADRDGKTQQEVIAEWRRINREANEYGTAFHEILERYLLAPYRMYSPRDDFEKRAIAQFVKMCNEWGLRLTVSNTLHPERIMSLEFNDTLGIAGTSDIIEDIDNNMFNVWDFKTNKEFLFESKYNEYMKFPIQHLPYCQYNSYVMQLSVYGVMYERETGRKFNRAGLFYWDKITETFTLYPAPYMKKEAEALIGHYKMKLLTAVN